MASLDVVSPALLLPIPVVSVALSLYNWRSHRYTPVNSAVLALLAILAAVAGGTGLSAACGEPLRVVAKVFATILESALSAISVYALRPSFHSPTMPPSFLVFLLSLASILVTCELVSALIPGSPLLLPAAFSLASRILLLFLAVCTAIISLPQRAKYPTDTDVEKSRPTDEVSRKKPGRVSSPTPGTWPFPGSLASQDQPVHTSSPGTTKASSVPNLPLSLTLSRKCDVDADHREGKPQTSFPFALLIAQIFATISATLDVAGTILAGNSIWHHGPPVYILIAEAAFTLLWAIAVFVVIQTFPVRSQSDFSGAEQQDGTSPLHGPIRGEPNTHGVPTLRTLKPSITRHVSDSALDFLSLHDPFASSPPPPPPLPPVGLGLDEVDVGWNGNNGIGLQYRFPAPRSIAKGAKRKGKKVRARGRKQLVHQDSSRTLLPVPPLPKPRGSEVEAEKDRGFGDEARLAELLLQSLNERDEELECPITPSSPTVSAPKAAQIPLSSRWSTSTTVRSTMSASISGRSGVSTYVSCTSEKVQGNRISMNTIASVLGSRKSTETRRKSAMTASSSKG